jgi:diphthamide biosynthesis enzyme Dph1/Dph2-like protein
MKEELIIKEIEGDYDLELDRVIRTINKSKAKTVLIQLPDGLKQKATSIVGYIEEKTKATCLIWLGSCFGACDVPPVKNLGIDLLIQFGHSEWKK